MLVDIIYVGETLPRSSTNGFVVETDHVGFNCKCMMILLTLVELCREVPPKGLVFENDHRGFHLGDC